MKWAFHIIKFGENCETEKKILFQKERHLEKISIKYCVVRSIVRFISAINNPPRSPPGRR